MKDLERLAEIEENIVFTGTYRCVGNPGQGYVRTSDIAWLAVTLRAYIEEASDRQALTSTGS